MGLQHSRMIYDPRNRRLDLQSYARNHYTSISEWEIDTEGRMVCRETTTIWLEINNFPLLYSELHNLGLKGLTPAWGDSEKTVYSFKKR